MHHGNSKQNQTTENAEIYRPPHRLTAIIVVATLGGLLFGYDTGVINGALQPLREDFGLSSSTEGIVVSVLLIGAALGAVLGGQLADKYGRRNNLLLLAIVFAIGTISSTLAPNWIVLSAARFVLGIAVGGASATVPVYLAEIAPNNKRGTIVTRNDVMIVSGQLLAFIINAVIYSIWSDVSGIWRLMLLVAIVPAVFLFVGMIKMPESPRWLVRQKRDREALEILHQIREPDLAELEFKELKSVAELSSPEEKSLLSMIKQPWVRSLLVIGIAVGIMQQTSGINTIVYYGTSILSDAGFTRNSAIVFNVLNGVASVIGMIVALSIINKVSRRRFWIVGICLVTGVHVAIASVSLTMADSTSTHVLVLILILLLVFCIQSTIGPLSWVILSEIFPLRMRSTAIGACMLVCWIANCAVTWAYPVVNDMYGMPGVFSILAVLGLAGVIFSLKFIPETKGITLEEFETKFRVAR